MSGEDATALEGALEELARLSYVVTEKLYAALGGDADPAGDPDPEN
jgi:hypothetical protein